MHRPILLAGALALSIPALVFAQPSLGPTDPSNPAAAPLSPSQDRVNQPARGDESVLVREADILSGAAEDVDSETDRHVREEAARPKQVRTVRMGERIVTAPAVPQP